MIRKFGWMLAVLMMLFAVNASAGGFTIGANAGIMKFSGDAGEDVKTGMKFGATADYMFTDMFGAGANFSWNKMKHQNDGEDAAVVYPGLGLTGTITDEITVLDYGVHGIVMFPVGETPVKPYAVVGGGMYSPKENFETDNYSEEIKIDSKPGVRGGVGARWMATPQIGVGIEGNYHNIFTEGESTSFYAVALGLSWTLPMAAK